MAEAERVGPAGGERAGRQGGSAGDAQTIRGGLLAGSAGWSRALLPASLILGVVAQIQLRAWHPWALGLYVVAITGFLLALAVQARAVRPPRPPAAPTRESRPAGAAAAPAAGGRETRPYSPPAAGGHQTRPYETPAAIGHARRGILPASLGPGGTPAARGQTTRPYETQQWLAALFPARYGPVLATLALVAAAGVVFLLRRLPASPPLDVYSLLDAPPGASYWHVAALWAAGLVVYWLAFRERPGWPRWRWPGWPAQPVRRAEWLAVAALLAVGLAARVVQLDSYPRVFNGDEASQALSAVGVVRGSLTNMFATGWYGVPTLFYFVQAIPLSVAPDSVVAARLADALLGTVTLGAAYLLARALCGRLVALVALAILATYDQHLFFSRMATVHLTDTFFGAVALLLAYRAVSRERPADYAATGLLLGLGFYGYFGAWVLPLVVAVLLGREAIVRRGWLRTAWPRIGVLVVGLALAIAPLRVFQMEHPEWLTFRPTSVSVFGSPIMAQEAAASGRSLAALVVDQAIATALVFNYGPPPRLAFYYNDPHGGLRWPAAVAFVLGMAYACWRWRDRRSAFLLVPFWLPVGAASFTEYMPGMQRLIITAPLVAIFIALGLVVSVRLLVRLSRVPRRLAGAGLAAVVLLSAALSLHHYFGEWSVGTPGDGLNGVQATELGYYLRDLGPATTAYLLGARFRCPDFATIAFIARDARCVDVAPAAVGQLTPLSRGGPVVAVAPFERRLELGAVDLRYPMATPRQLDDTAGTPLLFARQFAPVDLAAADESVRTQVARAAADYLAAASAPDPAAALRDAGWAASSVPQAAAALSRVEAEARAAGAVPFGEVGSVQLTRVYVDDATSATVVAEITGEVGLRAPDGSERTRERATWHPEYHLRAEDGRWRLDAYTPLTPWRSPAP